jgi:hypothetical protein
MTGKPRMCEGTQMIFQSISSRNETNRYRPPVAFWVLFMLPSASLATSVTTPFGPVDGSSLTGVASCDLAFGTSHTNLLEF